MRVRGADDLHAGAQRLADMLAGEVEAVGKTVDLECDPFFECDLAHPLEVEGVLRPAVDVPALGVAEAPPRRVAKRRLHAPGQLPAWHPLPAMDARLYPVELRERVVGKVEASVGKDVALYSAQHAKRRQQLVCAGDLLCLAANVVRAQPLHRPHRGRVIADREVVISKLSSGPT